MTRREVRKHLFCILFESGFYSEEERDAQYELYWEQQEFEPSEEEYEEIFKKHKAICEKLPQIDELIEKSSKGWKINRIGNADINILRIAVYEIKWDDEVPLRVAINEAVELAKVYGTDHSPGFINGILANIVKLIEKG